MICVLPSTPYPSPGMLPKIWPGGNARVRRMVRDVQPTHARTLPEADTSSYDADVVQYTAWERLRGTPAPPPPNGQHVAPRPVPPIVVDEIIGPDAAWTGTGVVHRRCRLQVTLW